MSVNLSTSPNTFPNYQETKSFHPISQCVGVVGMRILNVLFDELNRLKVSTKRVSELKFQIEDFPPNLLHRFLNDLTDRIHLSLQAEITSWVPFFSFEEGYLYFAFGHSPLKEPDRKNELTKFKIFSALVKNISPLILPSGKALDRTTFANHPIFEFTKEKNEVFGSLIALSMHPDYQKNYSQFLSNLKKENWFEDYTKVPRLLAYYSILAYFDDAIDEEELFVIHTAATAMQEDIDKVIQKANIICLTKDNLAEYLTQAGFPPFTQSKYPSIRNKKAPTLIEQQKAEIIESFAQRSPVKRTAVEYVIANFPGCKKARDFGSIDVVIYYKKKIGFKDIEEGVKGSVVLLPPYFTINLYERTTAVQQVGKHKIIFGYCEASDYFFTGGRIISNGSPLFGLPYVHNYTKGSALQVPVHDLHFHLPFEYDNPHIDKIIELAKRVKALRSSSNSENFVLRKLSEALVDREAPSYESLPPRIAFTQFIAKTLEREVKKEFPKPENYKAWFEKIFAPILFGVSRTIKNLPEFGDPDEPMTEPVKQVLLKNLPPQQPESISSKFANAKQEKIDKPGPPVIATSETIKSETSPLILSEKEKEEERMLLETILDVDDCNRFNHYEKP